MCASDKVPITAHLLRNSFFLKTVHSQKNGQVKRGGRERQRKEKIQGQKGMENYSPQHALIDILVITADEHK